VICLVGVIGFSGLILRALRMVLDGRGAETYRTFWLVEFSWIGLLIMCAVAALAFGVALLFQWREERQWQQLERKYGVRDPDS
jgi:hypothetical protein